VIDYFLEGLKRGLNPSQSGRYEDTCLKRDKAIKKYNEAIRDNDDSLKMEQANVIYKCLFDKQKLLMGRG